MGVAAVVGDETSRPWLSCGRREKGWCEAASDEENEDETHDIHGCIL